MAGVIPAIFASSIILFPATIASWFRGRYWLELADNNFAVFAAWATALCVTLCVCNHLLLFLLHGVGFQPA
ncbi:hypothetical protein MJ389_24915 [Escherichia coli]|nr:hypothetical protein MJ389_24915 [Escherichia coli]